MRRRAKGVLVYCCEKTDIDHRCCPGVNVSPSGSPGSKSYGGAHHFAAKQPPWRKLSLIIWIIMVFSCIPSVRTRSLWDTPSTHAS